MINSNLLVTTYNKNIWLKYKPNQIVLILRVSYQHAKTDMMYKLSKKWLKLE